MVREDRETIFDDLRYLMPHRYEACIQKWNIRNTLYYTIPVHNIFIAFFVKRVLQSYLKYLYWKWTFAEQMESQHLSNHTIDFGAFQKQNVPGILNYVG